MLKEIPNTRQHPGEPLRRWFCSHEQDLYVWHNENGEIVSFQLCYSKHHNEHALYWKTEAGFSHLRVDDGESGGLSSNTPILLADGTFDSNAVLSSFLNLASVIPPDVVEFVATRIKECQIFNAGESQQTGSGY